MLTFSLRNINIKFDTSDCIELSQSRYICGSICGYYNPFEEIRLSKEEVVAKISNASLEDVEDVLLYALGDFFVVSLVSNSSLVVITSPGHRSGLYYTKINNIFLFSPYENDVYKSASQLSLNEEFIFNDFYGEPMSILSGKTFFKETKRLLASSKLIIHEDGSFKIDYYILEKFKMLKEHSFNERGYREKFYKSMEVTVDIITKNYQQNSVYLLLSDGIDSLSVFFALLKTGRKFTVINIANFSPLIGMVKTIKELTEANERVNFVFLNIKSKELSNIENLEDIKKDAKAFFRFEHNGPMQCVFDYFKKNKIVDSILLTGGGFDIIYAGRKTGSSIDVGLSFYHAYIKFFLKRFYRSYFYIKMLAVSKYSKIFQRVRDKSIPYDSINYVASFVCGPDALDDGFYPFTMPDKCSDMSSEEFKKILLSYQKYFDKNFSSNEKLSYNAKAEKIAFFAYYLSENLKINYDKK